MIDKLFGNYPIFEPAGSSRTSYRSNSFNYSASAPKTNIPNLKSKMYDTEEFKFKLLDAKRELCEVKHENASLRLRLRKAEREIQKGADQISQLLDPRRGEHARRTFTEIGASMIVSLQQKNENLENELMHKDMELRDIRDQTKKLEDLVRILQISSKTTDNPSSMCTRCHFAEESDLVQSEKNRLQSNINQIRKRCLVSNSTKPNPEKHLEMTTERNLHLRSLHDEVSATRRMVAELLRHKCGSKKPFPRRLRVATFGRIRNEKPLKKLVDPPIEQASTQEEVLATESTNIDKTKIKVTKSIQILPNYQSSSHSICESSEKVDKEIQTSPSTETNRENELKINEFNKLTFVFAPVPSDYKYEDDFHEEIPEKLESSSHDQFYEDYKYVLEDNDDDDDVKTEFYCE